MSHAEIEPTAGQKLSTRSVFKHWMLWTGVPGLLAIPLWSFAGEPITSGLNTFTANTPISASKMNDNFKVLGDFMTRFEAAITVDDTGKVGVGVANPSQALQVNGTVQATSFVGNGSGLTDIPGLTQWADVSDGISYSGGNVGIGTSSPEARLVIQDASIDGDVDAIRFGHDSLWYNSFSARSSNNNDANNTMGLNIPNSAGNKIRVMTLVGNGNVGIGTTDPAFKLDVNGQVRASNVAVTSDRRLKKDIAPLKDALAGIECLQGVSYVMRDPKAPQGTQLGLIAQDVEKCFPEVVSTDPSGMKAVSYDRLVAPLIEAVKEQQTQLELQQTQLEFRARETHELRAALDAQNVRLARLEARLSARR